MKTANKIRHASGIGLDRIALSFGLERLAGETDNFLRERLWIKANDDPRKEVLEERYPQCIKATHDFDATTWRCVHCDALLSWFVRDGQHVANASLEMLLYMKREADKHMEAGWMRVLGFAIERRRNIEQQRADLMPYVNYKLKAPPCEHRFTTDGRCSDCRIVMTPCRFKGCQRTIAAIFKTAWSAGKATLDGHRLCERHAVEKAKLENTERGLVKLFKAEDVTTAGKLVAEPSTCDVGADWEDL